MDKAEIGDGLELSATSPLAAAVAVRDADTIKLVQGALRDMRTALAYQPVVIASDPTRVAFYEGLIRVFDENGRVIPARDFMGAIETSETGRLIDHAALCHGLEMLERVPDLRLAINMSARSIGYGRWLQKLYSGLDRDPTVGERLILEITEGSAMLMPDVVSAFMDDLHRYGVTFALDDFGAGFTAFRYFKEFFFDIVKIDGQFICNVASHPDNQVLTRALVSIARHFDMLCVAEAVENRADALWLAEAGVDCLQGYHVGVPMLRPDWFPEAAKAG